MRSTMGHPERMHTATAYVGGARGWARVLRLTELVLRAATPSGRALQVAFLACPPCEEEHLCMRGACSSDVKREGGVRPGVSTPWPCNPSPTFGSTNNIMRWDREQTCLFNRIAPAVA